MAEVGLETKLGWEFRKSVSRIHFNAVVSTAASVRRLEGAMVGWAVEGHKLVYAITDTLEGAT